MRRKNLLNFADLSIDQKLGMVLCARKFYGADEDNVGFIVELIKNHALGCVQLNANLHEVNKRILDAADYPLLVFNDTERGFPTSTLPKVPLMSLAACDNPAYYRSFARCIARDAKAAGFNVKRTKFLTYTISGVIAAVAGMMRVCMMQQCHPTNMLGMEMNIIAGVVLGGTSMTGGAGTMVGCVLGTLLIVLVENSMILLGIPTTWKSVFVGAVIVIGVAVSAMQVMRAAKAAEKAKVEKFEKEGAR
jgi:hypothetical protein